MFVFITGDFRMLKGVRRGLDIGWRNFPFQSLITRKKNERKNKNWHYIFTLTFYFSSPFISPTHACMHECVCTCANIHMYTFPCEKFFLFLWCSFIFLDTYTPLNTILTLVGFYYVLLHVYAYMV